MNKISIKRDPKPSVERVESLAKRIVEGDILLPKFQRDFVWSRGQIIELFDSISKNYPIGSILLWLSRQQLRSEKSIADLPVAERAEEYPVNYLLDGQQRLSTICGALFWSSKHGDPESVWNIVYDLRARTFSHLYTLDDPPLHQIRLNKIPNAAAYFSQVAAIKGMDAKDSEALALEAERLFALFKDYSIASVTLHDMPIEDVAPIFERINSTGTKLTIVDLMRAATWSSDFDLVDAIENNILSELAEKNFSSVERKAVLRSISAAAGGGFSVASIDNLRKLNAEELKVAAAATQAAFKLSVDFLKSDIGAPNAEIIPYVNQIVVLSEVFRRIHSPNAVQLSEIKKWFWRTTLSGYFSGWNTGQMSNDLAAVQDFVSGLTNEISVTAFQPSSNIWRSRTFRLNNAHSKMLGLMLSHYGAFDLVSGQKVSLEKALAWQNQKEYHHIFPQAYLRAQAVPSSRINALANFALLSSASNKKISDRRPSEYLAECIKGHGDDFNRIARSNFLSPRALEAALENDFESFLAERAATLHDHSLALCGLKGSQ
ncbi:GmrSD restriction endonuclease domain-containing protein [Cereibacter johrii]|uniref:GmrSD restriction endonuclease domain-containing protein n=1 Tax=Cereibacter johrii TaxID=445629 RepID=UPI003CF9394F